MVLGRRRWGGNGGLRCGEVFGVVLCRFALYVEENQRGCEDCCREDGVLCDGGMRREDSCVLVRVLLCELDGGVCVCL